MFLPRKKQVEIRTITISMFNGDKFKYDNKEYILVYSGTCVTVIKESGSDEEIIIKA